MCEEQISAKDLAATLAYMHGPHLAQLWPMLLINLQQVCSPGDKAKQQQSGSSRGAVTRHQTRNLL